MNSTLVTVIAVLSLVVASADACAQTAGTPSTPVELSPIAWQFGSFVDAGYLRDFNHPSNHSAPDDPRADFRFRFTITALKGAHMLDLLFVAITIAFFVLAAAYVAACARLE